MQVSSLTQSYLTSLYTNSLNKTENTTDTTTSFLNVLDSVSLSENAQKMPPPPHEMDFENMSDSDLQGYLQQMYDVTGTLPAAAWRATYLVYLKKN